MLPVQPASQQEDAIEQGPPVSAQSGQRGASAEPINRHKATAHPRSMQHARSNPVDPVNRPRPAHGDPLAGYFAGPVPSVVELRWARRELPSRPFAVRSGVDALPAPCFSRHALMERESYKNQPCRHTTRARQTTGNHAQSFKCHLHDEVTIC